MITGQLKRVIEFNQQVKTFQPASGSNIISFISGKGGTGKTTISLITALALAKEKRRVLLVDLDLGFPNINVLLNQTVTKSLNDFCFNNLEMREIIHCYDDYLNIIFGLSENPLKLTSTKYLLKSIITEITKLRESYDFVILDLSAGIDEFKMWALTNSNAKVIVSSEDPTSIMDAYALIKIFEKSESPSNFLTIINKSSSIQVGKESFLKLNKAVNSFLKSSVELLAVIQDDELIKNAVFNQNIIEVFDNHIKKFDLFNSYIERLNIFVQVHNINHSNNLQHSKTL
jgi:flagellar biosynthesis protein FlhG